MITEEIKDSIQSPGYGIQSQWTGGFWAERMKNCHDKMIPHMWALLKDEQISHCWTNFLIAAGELDGEHSGPPFHDGDFYKWLEAASRVYGKTEDKSWSDLLDSIICVIKKVQRPDGYIFTYDAINKRNRGESEALQNDLNFEVYNMGHLMSAGSVHYKVSGKKSLLTLAEKAAGYLAIQFSSLNESTARTAICPSHYMGLYQLYQVTGKETYLDLLEKLIELRDSVAHGTDDNQDRIPLKKQRKIVGHAVRANYLYAGLADLYSERNDREYRTVLESVWNDLTSKKISITGGCGALYDGVSPYGCDDYDFIQRTHQSYGRAYELPNTAGYNETCAAIGNYLWNYRMAGALGESKYADYMERSLYNSILSGINLEGDRYFYTNALRSLDNLPYTLKWSRHRESYITSFCCPPNVVRTIAGTSDLTCIGKDQGLAFLMYGDCRVKLPLPDNKEARIKVNTEYPWDGDIQVVFESCSRSEPFPLFLRIPEWSDDFSVSINDNPLLENPVIEKGFLILRRSWKAGDRIQLSLSMKVSLFESHSMVEETRNHIAVTRGPIVYCLETVDIPDYCEISRMYIDADCHFTLEKELIESVEVTVLKGQLWFRRGDQWSGSQLYRKYIRDEYEKVDVTLVPYFAWDNRKRGEMTVWLPLLPKV